MWDVTWNDLKDLLKYTFYYDCTWKRSVSMFNHYYTLCPPLKFLRDFWLSSHTYGSITQIGLYIISLIGSITQIPNMKMCCYVFNICHYFTSRIEGSSEPRWSKKFRFYQDLRHQLVSCPSKLLFKYLNLFLQRSLMCKGDVKKELGGQNLVDWTSSDLQFPRLLLYPNHFLRTL